MRCLIALTLLTSAAVSHSQPRLTGDPWADMNYGPFMKFSVQVSEDNIAYKGLAVRLDPGEGGIASGNAFMVFDTDTMRWAGGWTSDTFIDWRGIAMNGEHEIHPSIAGALLFENPVAPGWGHPADGHFNDERVLGRDNKRYGPLAKDWARWNGHYVHGDHVILSYRIGDARILEMPGLIGDAATGTMTRTLNVGPRHSDLTVQILAGTDASIEGNQATAQSVATGPFGAAFVKVLSDGDTELRWTDDALRLHIPANPDPQKITIGIRSQTNGTVHDLALRSLSEYTTGGARRWTETLSTKGKLSEATDPYVIDVIQHPVDNPYRSWLRFTGFDFFDDDAQAAIGTWNGDIWRVSGIDDALAELKWQRIATGMFQPLGIVIRDGDIYALCRDQITILRDLNDDGETDFYENFNSDHQVTEHFHEFALDLKLGDDGDFYYTKGGRHGADSITPNHGTLIRVSADGTESDFVANGFRAPNGLGLGPNDEMLVADNQGHWIPANRVNWVDPGGFYGYMWGYHEGQEISGYDEPLLWIHPSVDRSPGTFVWVPDDRWGPFENKIISTSYGMGQMFHVMHEEIDGVRQGAVTRFPLDFPTGITRATFRNSDGQLYTAGLFGWASNKTQPGGFYRVRYTGAHVNMPLDLHVASDGVAITFTDPVDATEAADPGNYGIQRWNYEWREKYGSPDFKLDGSRGRDRLRASWAGISPDQRTVFLEIPGIQPAMQMDIQANLITASGGSMRHQLHHTVHTLGPTPVREMLGDTSDSASLRNREIENTEPGLIMTISADDITPDPFTTAKLEDVRALSNAAFYGQRRKNVTDFISGTTFSAFFTGHIEVDFNETFRFHWEGTGSADMTVNGIATTFGDPVKLRQGLNKFTIDYTPPKNDNAEFRLLWESDEVFREPVPAAVFRRDSNHPGLIQSTELRHGRNLVAKQRCFSCHAPGSEFVSESMPELHTEAPPLDDVGARFSAAWLRDWITDPSAMDPHATMPRVLVNTDLDQNRRDANDIATYLASLSTREEQPRGARREVRKQGEDHFNQLGCITCHTVDPDNPDATRRSLANVASKWHPTQLQAFLKNPSQFHPDGGMPNFRLSDDEAASIAGYLAALPPSRDQQNFGPGDANHGRDLLTRVGCLDCHKLTGHTSTATAPQFLRLDTSRLNHGCVSPTLGTRGAAPDLGLSTGERNSIRRFLTEQPRAMTRTTPAKYAERTLERLDCVACHEINGAGNRLSTLRPDSAPAEDGSIHVGRPALTFAGEKLRTDWLINLLKGKLPYKTRPALPDRMPHFAMDHELFAEGLAALHGLPPVSKETASLDTEPAEIGRDLALSAERFRCNTCHGMGVDKPLAGDDTETINFAVIPERLRKPFFHRFTADPQRYMPGTQMPAYVIEDGSSTISDVLDGDAEAQFNALWEFMKTLKN